MNTPCDITKFLIVSVHTLQKEISHDFCSSLTRWKHRLLFLKDKFTILYHSENRKLLHNLDFSLCLLGSDTSIRNAKCARCWPSFLVSTDYHPNGVTPPAPPSPSPSQSAPPPPPPFSFSLCLLCLLSPLLSTLYLSRRTGSLRLR